MKKIVGIIAALAMAGAVFAVDFSAGVRLEGSLFNYNDGSISLFKEAHVNEFYQAPISFSISDDVAGGQLKISNVKDLEVGKAFDGFEKDDDGKITGVKEKAITLGNVVTADAWSIWFKPVDILKVTVGRWSTNLNQEHIGWCNTDSGIESDGYALTLATEGFSWDVFLASGNGNFFFTKADGADAVIKELYTKVQYGADFGTVNAFFNGANNLKDFRFGAGLNLSGLPVGLWFNVIGAYVAEDFQRIRVEADVSTTFGSIGWELFLAGGYDMKAGAQCCNGFTGVEGWHVGGTYYRAEPAAFCGFYTRFNIPGDGMNFYVEIKDADVLAKDFSMTLKPGLTKNFGCCAFEMAIDATLAKKVAIDVPVNFKVSF
jgi:hypothetical protein